MPIELLEPKFDRSFDEIYEELRARIPRYNPAWTNFNDSDPGVTLLQLFAWLAEMTLHRMNDVPRKNYLKFAKLLGLELEGVRPARVRLVFEPKPAEPPGTIKEGARYSAQVAGTAVIFETVQALDAIGAKLDKRVVLADGSISVIEEPSITAPKAFYPLGRNPQSGDALYLGFKPNPNNAKPFPLKMRFLALRPSDATSGVPQRVGEQNKDLVPPVDLVWEYRPKSSQAAWERLQVFEDETVAFTRDGYIDVEGPQSIEAAVDESLKDHVPDPLFWLRVRLDQNAYPAGRPPRLDFFAANGVDAVNLTTEQNNLVLGASSGNAEQAFDFPSRPVSADKLEIEIQPVGLPAEKDWQRVEDFFASKRDDKHFVLEASIGRIKFGDGLQGAIPTAGASVVAVKWRHGGGKAGNQVGPGAVKTMLTQVPGIEKVSNPRAAAGGADEQELNEFIKRAPAQLRSNKRAITESDFESVAEAIDGVKKARALGGHHPDFPNVSVPGAVTVLLVPESDAKPPKPSAELIRSVCTALEQVRLITTEVYVAAPEFIEIRVEALLFAAPNVSFDEVARQARRRLDEFLNPVNRRFGEDISLAAIYNQLFGVPGKEVAGVKDIEVQSVENLIVYVNGRQHEPGKPIDVPANALVYSGNHFVVVRPTQDAGLAR